MFIRRGVREATLVTSCDINTCPYLALPACRNTLNFLSVCQNPVPVRSVSMDSSCAVWSGWFAPMALCG